MAGKHRKSSRPVTAAVAPGGLAAAAVAATSLATAVVTGTTTAAAPSVGLLALITPANSTAQIFAGTTYYGTDYANPPTYGEQQVVPFLAGPQGIATAISDADDGDGPNRTVVLASGWGAGQTGTALGTLDDDELDDIDLVILDNNSNRAGGGFWTTYAPFAPLLATSAEPTPDNLAVPILDVAYEYNINSNAPTDPLNPFALGNSLAAYVYGYGAQSTAVIPQEAVDNAQDQSATAQHYHYIVDENGTIIDTQRVEGNITYVTVKSPNLPLTRPLRLIPGGDILADALDPTLTELVNAGYQDGQPIPDDPGQTRPMTPGSSIGNLGGVPGSVPVGLEKGAQTAKDDLSDPTKFVTKPLGEFGKLPGISSLPSLTNSTSTTNRLSTTVGNLFTPGANKPAGASASGSPGGANPVKSFTDKISDEVNKVTGGLHKVGAPGADA
jgi:hypothetical protein